MNQHDAEHLLIVHGYAHKHLSQHQLRPDVSAHFFLSFKKKTCAHSSPTSESKLPLLDVLGGLAQVLGLTALGGLQTVAQRQRLTGFDQGSQFRHWHGLRPWHVHSYYGGSCPCGSPHPLVFPWLCACVCNAFFSSTLNSSWTARRLPTSLKALKKLSPVASCATQQFSEVLGCRGECVARAVQIVL